MAQLIRGSSTKSAKLHAVVFAGVFLAAGTTSAAQLTLPNDHNLDLSINEAHSDQQSSLPPNSDLAYWGTRPLWDFLGTQFDLNNGQVQLFRFRLDSVPTTSTAPKQQINAGGIRLKWNW